MLRRDTSTGDRPLGTDATRQRVQALAAALVALAGLWVWSIPDLGLGLASASPTTATSWQASSDGTAVSPLGTPAAPGALVSTVVARLFLALAPGSPVDRLGLMAVLAGALSVFLLVRVYQRIGLDNAPAVIGAAFVASGGSLLALALSGSADTLAAPLLLALVLCGVWWVQTRSQAALATLAATTAATVGSYPVSLALVSVIVAVQIGLVRREATGWRPLVLTVGAAGVGLVHRAGAAFLAAGAAAEVSEVGADVPPGPLAWLTGLGLGLRTPEDTMSALAALATLVPGELGLLGGLMAVAGLVFWARLRAALACAAAAATALWIAVWLPSTPAADQAALMLLVWLPAGAGLQWALSSSPSRSARLGVAALAVLLVASGVIRHNNRIPWFADPVRTEYAEQLLDTLTRPTWVLAEQPALGRALALGTGLRGGIRPREVASARRAVDRGDDLLVLPEGRRQLEPLGLQFTPVPTDRTTVPLRRFLQLLPRRSVVAAAVAGGVWQATAREAEAPFIDVGASLALTGDFGAYAVVGVARGDGAALEEVAGEAVRLEVEAGQPIGGHTIRSPVTLRLESHEQGAWVEVDGERLADTRRGLALVVLTPDGRVLTAFGVEGADELRVPLPSVDPQVWQVNGAEPCVPLPANQRVEVTAVTAAGAVATTLPPGAEGVVELDLGVEQLELEDTSGRVLLRRTPDQAFARLVPGGAGVEEARLCGSVWGEPRFVAGGDSVSPVPLPDLDRIGWGWHNVEEDGGGLFRWSDGPEMELFVQLVRIGSIRVEVDTSGAAVGLSDDPVTLAVAVNGSEMPPQEMASGVQTYGWTVPSDRWKTGMNSIRLRVSAAVVPATAGLGNDERSLGLGLRRLDLTLLP